METHIRRPHVSWPPFSVFVVLGVCWGLAWLGPLSLGILILLPLFFWRAFRRRCVISMALIVLANPLSYYFISGVVDYAGGRPALRSMGLPGPEFGNLDPKTRCRRSTGGCLVSGREWVWIAPHNFALRLITMVFGPPSGTYDGPYPTREEAVEASTPGTLVSPEDFAAGRIPTEDGVVQLDPAMLEKIGQTSFEFILFSLGEWELEEGETLHAALVDERCLILRLRHPPALMSDDVATEVVLLIDAKNSRPFAIYRISGNPRIRRAAVSAFW